MTGPVPIEPAGVETISDVTDKVGRRHVVERHGGYEYTSAFTGRLTWMPDRVVYRGEERIGDKVYSASITVRADDAVGTDDIASVWRGIDRELDARVIEGELSPPTPTEMRLIADEVDLDAIERDEDERDRMFDVGDA